MKKNPFDPFDYSKEYKPDFLIENKKDYTNNFKIIIDPMPCAEELETTVIYKEDETL